jgi:hypothetical protein
MRPAHSSASAPKPCCYSILCQSVLRQFNLCQFISCLSILHLSLMSQSASCFPRAQASNGDAEGVQQRGKGRSAARQRARPCHPVHRAVALLSCRRKNNGGGGGGGGGGGVGKADSGKLNFVASARAEHCVNWVTVLGRMALDLMMSASAEDEVGITLLLPWTVCSALMTIFIHSSSSSSDSLSV